MSGTTDERDVGRSDIDSRDALLTAPVAAVNVPELTSFDVPTTLLPTSDAATSASEPAARKAEEKENAASFISNIASTVFSARLGLTRGACFDDRED